MTEPFDFDEEELIEILEEDNGEWTSVTSEKIVDQSRWMTQYEQVFKHREMDRYIEIGWSRGSTEYQDDGIEDVYYNEVYPVQVVRTEYVTTKPE